MNMSVNPKRKKPPTSFLIFSYENRHKERPPRVYSVGGRCCLFVLFNYELFSFSARIVPEMHFFRSDKESTQFQKVPKLRAFLAIIGDKYEVTTFGL